ncbi:hypothetical protein FPRO05_09737 [Fusarium proliferatum]|uniref:Uncharacterized protein n=1 Tax=Gibberella intermedia TaxID=948311 RepID=A0A365NFR4_GIBIN|nr:hypothetical protein FPRO05_09737 [Fusarium proliferatum]
MRLHATTSPEPTFHKVDPTATTAAATVQVHVNLSPLPSSLLLFLFILSFIIPVTQRSKNYHYIDPRITASAVLFGIATLRTEDITLLLGAHQLHRVASDVPPRVRTLSFISTLTDITPSILTQPI